MSVSKKEGEVSFSQILAGVEEAASKSATKEDVVSFCTVLDIYIEQLSKYTDDEKIQFVDTIKKLFESNHDLLYKASWDLPQLFINILESNWIPRSGGLRNNVAVVKYMGLFGMLASYGEPKSLLLACCEQISKLRIKSRSECKDLSHDSPLDLDESHPTNFAFYCNFVIEFHTLLEAINVCLRRSVSLWPSKYLATVVTCLVNFIKTSPSDPASIITVVRRMYTFIRDYIPPELPQNADLPANVQVSELPKIVSDENYLQRKLLVWMLSVLVEGHTRQLCTPFVALLVSGYPQKYVEAKWPKLEFMGRFVTLGMSMDLEYDTLLQNEIDRTEKLFPREKVAEFKTSDDILKVVIDGFNEDLHHEAEEISFSAISTIILYTCSTLVSKEKFSTEPLRLIPLVKLQLRLFVPFSIKPQLIHYTAVTCGMVLMLEAIGSHHDESLAGLADPGNRLLLSTYLQNLSAICLNSENKVLISFFYRFLAKILRDSSEEMAYSFLLDTIQSCPFEKLQVGCITILNELMSKDKDPRKYSSTLLNYSASENARTNKVAGSAPDISDGVKDLHLTPPPLPPRNTAKDDKYINYTLEREKSILDVFDRSLTDFSKRPIHVGGRILAFVNLLSSQSGKFTRDEVVKRFREVAELATKLQECKEQIINGDGQKVEEAGEKEENEKLLDDLVKLGNILNSSTSRGLRFYEE